MGGLKNRELVLLAYRGMGGLPQWPVAAGFTSPSRRDFDFLPARFGEFLQIFNSITSFKSVLG